jgi:hypothetical protein
MLNKSKATPGRNLAAFYDAALSQFKGVVSDATQAFRSELAKGSIANLDLFILAGQQRVISEVFAKLEPIVDQVVDAHFYVGDRDIKSIAECVDRHLLDVACDHTTWASQSLAATRGLKISAEIRQNHWVSIHRGKMRLKGSLGARVVAALLKRPKQSRYDAAFDGGKNHRIVSVVLLMGVIAGAINGIVSASTGPLGSWLKRLWQHHTLL